MQNRIESAFIRLRKIHQKAFVAYVAAGESAKSFERWDIVFGQQVPAYARARSRRTLPSFLGGTCADRTTSIGILDTISMVDIVGA